METEIELLTSSIDLFDKSESQQLVSELGNDYKKLFTNQSKRNFPNDNIHEQLFTKLKN